MFLDSNSKMISSNFNHFQNLFISSSTNPYLNLASELFLFQNNKKNQKILFIWRNEPVVVIGKHQNPFKECNLDFMKEKNIKLARRITGGGAVYQDLGNTCWTFISNKLETKINNQILCKSLLDLNINCNVSGRNDLEVDGKKISGAAFRKTNENSIHHGTMLINVNLNNLERALNVDKSILSYKGVDSVRSRVINLNELNTKINHKIFCDSLIKNFKDEYTCTKIRYLSEKELKENECIRKIYNNLRAKEWVYYKSFKKFQKIASKKFDFGLFELTYNTELSSPYIFVYSDCLYTSLIHDFEKYINNTNSSFESQKLPILKKYFSILTDWFNNLPIN